ncbi:NUDIX hydrolase [Deinococcus petrolearius]|uniref:NUDIX hydrolase n=1 Tax=Deinococcus petrolearius TaxID=1751295 RepID=A0ABW1DH57_9DEIO
MTDIRLPLGGLKFSVRVAVLCVRAGRLLVNAQRHQPFAFLPGGALATGEDVYACAAREWQEETGTPPGPLRLVGVVENFFGPPDRRQHEIGFYFHMEAPPELPEASFTLLDNAEVYTEWVPLAEVAARPVYPRVVAELLDAAPGEVRHVLNREA